MCVHVCLPGRALLRLKDHHLEVLGVEAEEQQQEILQDLLLLRVREEINELCDICSGENNFISMLPQSSKFLESSRFKHYGGVDRKP